MAQEKSYPRFSPNDLLKFCEECFVKVGVPREYAQLIADHLVTANLRGVDSHGVIRIPYYIEGLEKGYVKPKAEIKILKESPHSALLDGGDLLGIVPAMKATELVIEKAKSAGLAIVGVKRLGHVGMLAYYTKKIAEEKLIGFACANCPPRVAPWGGAGRVFGTNPFSIGLPAGNRNPIIIDMATSATAAFKIQLALKQGKKLPPGIALDKNGKPTTDPKEAVKGVLLPFGGHKGYAIALLVEILSSAFIGGLRSSETIDHASTQGGFLVAAIDPTLFREYDEYVQDLEEIISEVKGCKRMEGVSEVLLPGEIEDRTYSTRLREGIPIDPETLKSLEEVGKRLGVPFPSRIA